MGRITNEALDAKIEDLHDDIKRLQSNMETLLADYNKRRGVMSLLVWVGTCVGGAAAWVVTRHIFPN